ncbi:MAG: hypothetical protein K2O01_00700 [Bacteroidales bacterium]|nr:hypothetical protein [Bacteroidales bacterium]
MKATTSMESLWQTISSLSSNNRKNQLTKAENIAITKGLIDIWNGQTIRIQNIHHIWESIV